MRYYLEEEPLLSNVETYVGALPSDRRYILQNIGDLVLMGKYKSARGKIVAFGRDHWGNPTVEIEPNRYMTDSDRLIEHYANRKGLRPDEMPVLSLYKQGILPKLFELHKLKTGGAKS